MQVVLRTTNISTVNPLKASVRCASRDCSTIWKPRRRKLLTGGGPKFYTLALLHVNSLIAVEVPGGGGSSTSLATVGSPATLPSLWDGPCPLRLQAQISFP